MTNPNKINATSGMIDINVDDPIINQLPGFAVEHGSKAPVPVIIHATITDHFGDDDEAESFYLKITSVSRATLDPNALLAKVLRHSDLKLRPDIVEELRIALGADD